MKLIVLIGLPGSGKTTKRNELVKEGFSYISSDEIRKVITGDESNQTKNREVFNVFYNHLKINCENNFDTVLDATNITVKDRSKIFKVINPYRKNICVEGYVLHPSIKECIERDSKRDRNVGGEVISKLAKKFQWPMIDEGFDIIWS